MATPRGPVVVPTPVRALAVVVGVAALGLCGWQLVRDRERNEGREAALLVADLPVLTEPAPLGADVAWRVVRWSGRYDGAPELIAGRQHKSARGYGVVQRFVRDDGAAVLVDRGWIPADDVGGQLAELRPEATTLVAQLRPTFGRADSEPTLGHGTRIWPAKAWPALTAASGTSPDVVAVAGAEDGGRSANSHAVDGFERVPARDDTSLHYASQWVALAILAAIVAIPGAATRVRDFFGA